MLTNPTHSVPLTNQQAEAVWTHSELEYLAVLTLWQCRRRDRRPKLIAENVWLFDKWQRFSAPKRCLYRRLISQADVLTCLSPENLKIARELFTQLRSEFIRFGISSDTMVSPVQHAARHPVRIAALGNDMHRDVYGAREVGMWTVMFDSDQGTKEHLDCVPDYTISDHRELLKILDVEV